MALVSWYPFNGSDIDVINGKNEASTCTFSADDKWGRVLSGGAAQWSAQTATELLIQAKAISIAFWIYVPTGAGVQSFFNSYIDRESPPYRRYTLHLYPTPLDLHMDCQNNNSGTYPCSVACNGALTYDTWHHACWTYTNKTLKLYVDGALKQSWGVPEGLEVESTFSTAIYSWHVSGIKLTDCRIYNNALTPYEVRQLSQGLIFKLGCDELHPGWYRDPDYTEDTEDTATNVLDESGRQWNSTAADVRVVWDTTKKIQALSFNGNSRRRLYYSDFPQLTTSLTYSCWICPTAAPSETYSFIFGYGRDYKTAIGASIIMTGTNVGYLVGNGTSVVQQCTPISLGQWHMATLTYDNSVVKFYLNGEKQLESELTGPLNYADVGAPGGLTIGKMSSGADSPSSYFPFTGKIRDLRAYNTALGAEDILHLYQVSARISRQGVLTLFDIDERDIYLWNAARLYRPGIGVAGQFVETLTLDDGSRWLQIQHVDRSKYNTLFDTTTADLLNGPVRTQDGCAWANFPLIKTCDHGDVYEFLCIEQNGDDIRRYRWSQSVSPYDATFDDTLRANITPIEGLVSPWGGMHLYTYGGYCTFAFNNSDANNWYGCGVVQNDDGWPVHDWRWLTGIQDIYIRVYSNSFKQFNTPQETVYTIATEINCE